MAIPFTQSNRSESASEIQVVLDGVRFFGIHGVGLQLSASAGRGVALKADELIAQECSVAVALPLGKDGRGFANIESGRFRFARSAGIVQVAVCVSISSQRAISLHADIAVREVRGQGVDSALPGGLAA